MLLLMLRTVRICSLTTTVAVRGHSACLRIADSNILDVGYIVHPRHTLQVSKELLNVLPVDRNLLAIIVVVLLLAIMI